MASKLETPDDRELPGVQLQLQTAQYELSYERSVRAVEAVTKDEEIRKLRFQLALNEDENDTLTEELERETLRIEELRNTLDGVVAQSEQSAMEIQRVNNELRMKTRELDNLKAELDSMQSISKDTSKLLTEKLALVRELSTIKPELEFLKAQVAQYQTAIADKLEMQRELVTVKVELENERKSNQRLLARQERSDEIESQTKAELEELRKKLEKEKREREKANEAVQQIQTELEQEKLSTKKAVKQAKEDADQTVKLEALTQQLEEEKAERKKAEAAAKEAIAELQREKKAASKETKNTKKEEAKYAAQLEALQSQLEQERTERQRAEVAAEKLREKLDAADQAAANKSKKDQDESSSVELDQLRRQLSEEKKHRQAAEKEFHRMQRESKELLSIKEDKVKQFREKLRSVKEDRDSLRVRVEEAEAAAAAAAAATTVTTATAVPKISSRAGVDKVKANPRKRAATIDPDETALGTPGDMHGAKRNRRSVSTMPGEKSTFSITPFLNRTASVAPSSPEEDKDESTNISIAENTPTAKPAKTAKKSAAAKQKPLAPSATGKANTKAKSQAAPQRKKSAIAKLDAVAEEGNEENEDAAAEVATSATTTVPLKDPSTNAPVLKPKNASDKAKPRKSLMEFQSFLNDSDEKKKKRRLGGNTSGFGKTLFDNDDDDDAPPAKAIPGKGIFAARAINKSLGGKGPAIKGGYMFNSEGFQFSPLKKDRKKTT